MAWSASKPRLHEFTLADNTPIVVLQTAANPTGRITVNATGNFDSGDLQIGYLSDGVFTVYTDATSSAAGGYELAVGANKNVMAKATGASPAIILAIQAVS